MLYATVIVGSCANYAASPLFLELAVEMAFPVDETVVGGFMSCTYNLVGALFLFAFFIPNIGKWLVCNKKIFNKNISFFIPGVTWMNYCLVAAPAISLPFVFMAKEEYRRSSLDKECVEDRSLLINSTTGYEDEI